MNRNEVNRQELSPMMQQLLEIHDRYPDCILFSRIGDFYEIFFEEAELVSRECELTLTGKNAGLKERIPMCGVPHHSVKTYIEKLISKGYKVAICEQLEDPKTAKGMVKRDVIEVVTKGTMVDLEYLNERDFNYIGGLIDYGYIYLLTFIDLSTGSVNSEYIKYNDEELRKVLINLNIKELVVQEEYPIDKLNMLINNYGLNVSISSDVLENEYKSIYEDTTDDRVSYGVKHLLYYLRVKELKDLSHLGKVEIINKDDYIDMDVHTIRNLELIETLRLKDRKYSLIWLLDKTKTAMGARKLKSWLMNPLKDINEINKRYDIVEKLNNEFLLREELSRDLYEIYDLERLCGKVSCGQFNARDALQIKRSLGILPDINRIIKELKFDVKLDEHQDLYNLLERAIYEEPPISIKEGYLIKEKYNDELDELKKIRKGGKDFISAIEEEEKKRTGIQHLKVGFNKVFGYYIEVTKGQLENVKEEFHWERRQTLTGAGRFITPKLKEKEALVLNAEERINEIEYNLFCEIREILKKNIAKLKNTADLIASIDVYVSLSRVSEEYHLVRPKLNTSKNLNIIQGRHPVVEVVSGNGYVKNDCVMDEKTNTLLITGPNMSGKSTFMRQLAIIVIMAQMGSFVPCEEADLPIFDKIFTRIGASDDLVSGESTFMVEMLEANNPIQNATENSLILFDELGSGTSTYDGMSLARAILEYVSTKIKCKTLFSTHYHELTDLEEKIPEIKNVHVEASEKDGNVVFLHKVTSGATDKSYGIHVARLAGLPEDLLKNSEAILKKYEKGSSKKHDAFIEQISMDFSTSKEEDELKKFVETIDPLHTTPMEAMNILFKLKDMSKK